MKLSVKTKLKRGNKVELLKYKELLKQFTDKLHIVNIRLKRLCVIKRE